jgi:Cdc6-like AAA superfamily ATPase
MKTPVTFNTESALAFTIRHRIISYPAFKGALERVERLHQRSLASGHPGGLLITGLSGAGKSTVKNEYASRYAQREEDDITIIPVLKVDTPAGPTVKNLAEEILVALNDSMSHRGSAEQKTQRVYYFLKMCKVELIIFDEFQHFVENAKRSEISRITDWLKNLINKAKIPVVLLGLPSSEHLLKLNPQLARRFSSRYSLNPFDFSDEAGIQEFRGILRVIEQSLPLPTISLSSYGMAKRFYFATFGLIDFVGKIIDAAVLSATLEHADKLELHHYAEAFKEEVWRDVSEKLNPFSVSAKLRPLVKSNEPFAEIGDGYGKAISDSDSIKQVTGF